MGKYIIDVLDYTIILSVFGVFLWLFGLYVYVSITNPINDVNDNESWLMSVKPERPKIKREVVIGADLNGIDMVFAMGGTEYLRLEADGNIWVKGKPVSKDKEVVDAMREFLTRAKLI